MATARNYAELSHARRLHVGAIVVKDDRIISIGYNGMPAGWDNDCENREWWNPNLEDLHPDELESLYPYIETSDEDGSYIGHFRLKTKPEVLHAERNALDKLAKGNEGGSGATMFVTHAPCLECAKSIYGSGISTVYYGEDYRAEEGILFLKKCGVNIQKLTKEDK